MKKWLTMLLIGALVVTGFPAAAISGQPIAVTMNGEIISLEVQSILQNGRVLIPLRGISAMGELKWKIRLPAGEDHLQVMLGAAEQIYVSTGKWLWSITPQGKVAWVYPAPYAITANLAPSAELTLV